MLPKEIAFKVDEKAKVEEEPQSAIPHPDKIFTVGVSAAATKKSQLEAAKSEEKKSEKTAPENGF